MSEFQEKFELQKEKASLVLGETASNLRNFFYGYGSVMRAIIIGLLLAIIPGYFIARFSLNFALTQQLKNRQLTAQKAFQNPLALSIGEALLRPLGQNAYSVLIPLKNNNLDLSSTAISYVVVLQNSSGAVIARQPGTTYTLPGQTQNIIITRITAPEPVQSATLEITDPVWLKRLEIKNLEFSAPEPIFNTTVNPLTLNAEGAIVNQTPYRIKAATIQLVAKNQSGEIVAVAQREEYTIAPFARRGYKISWPNLYANQIARVEVTVLSNPLDVQNYILEEVTEDGLQDLRQ